MGMSQKDLSECKRKHDIFRHHAWAGTALLSVLLAVRGRRAGLSRIEESHHVSEQLEREKAQAQVEKERIKLEKKRPKPKRNRRKKGSKLRRKPISWMGECPEALVISASPEPTWQLPRKGMRIWICLRNREVTL